MRFLSRKSGFGICYCVTQFFVSVIYKIRAIFRSKIDFTDMLKIFEALSGFTFVMKHFSVAS